MGVAKFYQIVTDPYAGLKPQEQIDWTMARAGNAAGPYQAAHLKSIGFGMTALGSGFRKDAPPDHIIHRWNPGNPLRDFEDGFSFWIVSKRARDTLVEYAADSIDFVPAEVTLRAKDGKDIAASPRWLSAQVGARAGATPVLRSQFSSVKRRSARSSRR